MKIITVAGPPSCGKTSVIIKVIERLREKGISAGVVKFDCLVTNDHLKYKENNIPVLIGLSAGQCPDHYFITNIVEADRWAQNQNFDMLIVESAGLCNRCSPHLRELSSVCVMDYLAGMQAPQKTGPMLKLADLVIITKGDMVSQAEREVFSQQISILNPSARIISVNGLNGYGVNSVCRFFFNANECNSVEDLHLRFPMPSALCSYCLGGTMVGRRRQIGNTKRLKVM